MKKTDTLSNRQAAKRDGLTTYKSESPCIRGHMGTRRTNNAACVQCDIEQRAAGNWGESVEKSRTRKALYRQENADTIRAAKRAYNAANREKENARKLESMRRDVNGTHATKRLRSKVESFDRLCERLESKPMRDEVANARKRSAAKVRRDNCMLFESIECAQTRREANRLAYAEQFALHPFKTRLTWINKKARTRARGYGIEHDATAMQITRLGNAQRWQCAYCGSVGKLHLDHKTTMRLGGSHTLDNLQWLCEFHNMDKAGMSDTEYRILHGIAAVTPCDSF